MRGSFFLGDVTEHPSAFHGCWISKPPLTAAPHEQPARSATPFEKPSAARTLFAHCRMRPTRARYVDCTSFDVPDDTLEGYVVDIACLRK